jgi:hypothetical protein
MHADIVEKNRELPYSVSHEVAQVSPLERSLSSLQFAFPIRRNREDLDSVAWRNHTFLQRYGLLQSDTSLCDLPSSVRYATLLYPIAEDAALDIAVDAITWSRLCCDDYQHLRLTDEKGANMKVWQLVDLTLHRIGIQPADDAPPLVWAFANLWKREAAGMSLLWQQRAAANWRRWFLCLASEDTPAEHQTDASFRTHLPDRHSAECAVLGDLIEGSLKFELPRGAYESLQIEALRDIQADSMRWVSNVAAACGGSLPEGNVVRVIQRQWELSIEQAISKVITMHEQLMQRWRRLRDRVPQLYVTLHLDEDARIQLQRYVLGIESLITGHYAWHAKIA